MTSFSSSGVSGSSNASFMSGHDPHHPHTPMRVHFTDGSIAGSNIVPSKQEASKVCCKSLDTQKISIMTNWF